MKICQNCGNENEYNAQFCSSCGSEIENLDFNNTDFKQNNKTFNNTQYNQSQNYQQPSYNQNKYNITNEKNVWIAVILDIIGALIFYFLCGIGQIYLGLTKRAIVLCVTGLLITLINVVLILSIDEFISSIISLILGILLMIYCVYDAYVCTNAINQSQHIPLLFGFINVE